MCPHTSHKASQLRGSCLWGSNCFHHLSWITVSITCVSLARAGPLSFQAGISIRTSTALSFSGHPNCLNTPGFSYKECRSWFTPRRRYWLLLRPASRLSPRRRCLGARRQRISPRAQGPWCVVVGFHFLPGHGRSLISSCCCSLQVLRFAQVRIWTWDRPLRRTLSLPLPSCLSWHWKQTPLQEYSYPGIVGWSSERMWL